MQYYHLIRYKLVKDIWTHRKSISTNLGLEPGAKPVFREIGLKVNRYWKTGTNTCENENHESRTSKIEAVQLLMCSTNSKL